MKVKGDHDGTTRTRFQRSEQRPDGRRRSRSKYGAKRTKPGQEDAKGKGKKK